MKNQHNINMDDIFLVVFIEAFRVIYQHETYYHNMKV